MNQSFLEDNYVNWLKSRKILTSVNKKYQNQQVSSDQLKAFLENAVMYLLLYEKYKGDDFLDQIDDRHIEEGIRCVALEQELNNSISDIKSIITSSQVVDQEVKNIQPEESDLYYKVGDFKLTKNQYTKKAFDYVALNHNESTALLSVLTAALRYASIFSETRHIGPPQSVYDLFYDWGIRHEGFASPFNARLLGKEDANFYSLFYDTDAIFGSGGSFFDLDEFPENGHWCLDPPFIEETMNQVDEIIADWQNKRADLSIIYIIPASHKPGNPPDETVILKAGEHYYEGLAGVMKPLPVDVNIHRYGKIEDFSGDQIKQGYLPNQPIVGASRKSDRYKK
jgi:hypothetical protein